MGRAEDLFKRLEERGEQAIDELIADRQSEELFLDFKRSADGGAGRKLHDNDRANLAKAISGFGNSEGGIVIWGVDCARDPDRGDVASAKTPIQNPKRFLSWLEGAISGCSIPPHPAVSHIGIEHEGRGTGFVVTLIPQSHLAPHQCLKPLQYYIRAGSDFVPTPHAVLAGLFGRRPQPFVFHMWVIPEAELVTNASGQLAAKFAAGFQLASNGPGIARDLYLNIKLVPPGHSSEAGVEVLDRNNWTGQQAFGVIFNFVSVDSFKLAPHALVQPVVLHFCLAPPFARSLHYEITFGHGGSPVNQVKGDVPPETIERAFEEFVRVGGGGEWSRRFISEVLAI